MALPLAVLVWQCCTREPNMRIPVGATWVDYVPEVNDRIEANARQGTFAFEIFFETNVTVYQFDLVNSTQRNGKTGFQRPIRRVFASVVSRPVASRL